MPLFRPFPIIIIISCPRVSLFCTLGFANPLLFYVLFGVLIVLALNKGSMFNMISFYSVCFLRFAFQGNLHWFILMPTVHPSLWTFKLVTFEIAK